MHASAGLTTTNLADGLRLIVARLQTAADDLNALDGKLGDGDLGVTMIRGGRQVLEALPSFSGDVGQALLSCARAFTKVSGSSFGTLLAAGLMSAAKEAGQRTVVPWAEAPGLLRRAADTIAMRGKAEIGDKTLLDAVDAAARATEGLDDPSLILEAALKATESAMESLRDHPARVGRARIFPERSRGLDDPGMAAFLIMLQALSDQPKPSSGNS